MSSFSQPTRANSPCPGLVSCWSYLVLTSVENLSKSLPCLASEAVRPRVCCGKTSRSTDSTLRVLTTLATCGPESGPVAISIGSPFHSPLTPASSPAAPRPRNPQPRGAVGITQNTSTNLTATLYNMWTVSTTPSQLPVGTYSRRPMNTRVQNHAWVCLLVAIFIACSVSETSAQQVSRRGINSPGPRTSYPRFPIARRWWAGWPTHQPIWATSAETSEATSTVVVR